MADTLRPLLKKALALHRQGKMAKASSLYDEVLHRDPDNPDALHLKGLIHYDRQDHDKARQLISRALELRSDDPFYHHNIAAILSLHGEMAAAEGHYREAIRLKPDYAEAFFNLSHVIKVRGDDPLFSQIDRLLQSQAPSTDEECFLHFAAGKLHDDIGNYDQAFQNFVAGNRTKRVNYDPAVVPLYGRAIRDVFNREFLEAKARRSLKVGSPIFVVGMPRSGTTLIEQILASHPKVFGAGELPDMAKIAKETKRHDPKKRDYPLSLRGVPGDVLRGLAKAYLDRTGAMATQESRIVDKMPLNFWHLGLIVSLFRDAKIIHCKRDPLDTCLSCFFQNFTSGQEYSFDFDHLGAFYREYRAMMAHWLENLPIRFIEVSYEGLIADPDEASHQILEFCGLDWDDACSSQHRTKRKVMTASRWQVRQPIYKTSVNRWKNYEAHIGPLVDALAG